MNHDELFDLLKMIDPNAKKVTRPEKPEPEHARYCGKTPTTRSPSCKVCFEAGL